MKRGKKAQLMHLPFEIIFSIILIAVFIFVAFLAVRNFLEIQKCASIGQFENSLKEKVDEIWREQAAQITFENTLDKSIEYVCFANLSREKNLVALDSAERQIASKIYDELQVYEKRNANFFFYPRKAVLDCKREAYASISRIQLSTTNPLCFKNDGKVKIKLQKEFDSALVKIVK